MQQKYRCPKCGSYHIVWWEQYIKERRYNIKNDGEVYKRSFSDEAECVDPLEGVVCKDCGEYCNRMAEDNEFDTWINSENKEVVQHEV